MCTYIYTTTFQRSDNDRVPILVGRILSQSWNLSRRSCLAKPVICVVVLEFVRVQKKKKLKEKNLKC